MINIKNHFKSIYPKVFENNNINTNEVYKEIYSGIDLYQLAQDLEEVYEFVLENVSVLLSELHNISPNKDYWRVIIGPWLLHYLHFSYDKFLISKYMNKENLKLINQQNEKYYVPRDTISFFKLLEEDKYNLQGLQNISNSERSITENYEIVGKALNIKTKDRIKNFFNKSVNSILNKKKYVLAFGIRFPSIKTELDIFLRTKGKYQPYLINTAYYNEESIDIKVRESSTKVLIGKKNYSNQLGSDNGIFINLVFKNIFFDIPIIFLEGFNHARLFVGKEFPSSPYAVFTSTSTHYNELEKIWMAERKLHNNSQLIGMQHGGVYGSTEYSWYENHEMRINDYYLTWGWEKKSSNTKVIKMFPQKLEKKFKKRKTKDKILFVTTNQPRYVFRYPIVPGQMERYFVEVKNFLSKFPEGIANNLEIRLYPRDFGWNILEFLNDELKKYKFDQRGNFHESLLESKLFICDHPSTTFLEALYLNKPTILYWNSEENKMREAAIPYYENLRRVGILHENYESAINKIKEIDSDIDEWWFSSSVQSVRQEFCYKFSRKTENNLKEFIEFINEVTK